MDLLDLIDTVGRFVWRVPSPATLARWDDMQVAELYSRRGGNPWGADAVMAEMQRRDDRASAERAAARRRQAVTDRKQAARQRRTGDRADWQNDVEAFYVIADYDCRGVLVNNAGVRRGVDGRSLFYGPRAYAEKHASWELLRWWEDHPEYPRLTFAEWKAAQREPAPDPTVTAA